MYNEICTNEKAFTIQITPHFKTDLDLISRLSRYVNRRSKKYHILYYFLQFLIFKNENLKINGLLKYGFCKKLLLSECNSDQLNISWPFLSSLLGGCNSKATPNPPKSDDKMVKKCLTGQSCIRKEVTSYKIHTLEVDVFY